MKQLLSIILFLLFFKTPLFAADLYRTQYIPNNLELETPMVIGLDGKKFFLLAQDSNSRDFLQAVMAGNKAQVKFYLDLPNRYDYVKATRDNFNALHIAKAFEQDQIADLILEYCPELAWESSFPPFDANFYLRNSFFVLAIGSFRTDYLSEILKNPITKIQWNEHTALFLENILKKRLSFPSQEQVRTVVSLLEKAHLDPKHNFDLAYISNLLRNYVLHIEDSKASFLLAVKDGDIARVKAMMASKQNITIATPAGVNALHVAVGNKQEEIANLLLKHYPHLALARSPYAPYDIREWMKDKWLPVLLGTFCLNKLKDFKGELIWNDNSQKLMTDILAIHKIPNWARLQELSKFLEQAPENSVLKKALPIFAQLPSRANEERESIIKLINGSNFMNIVAYDVSRDEGKNPIDPVKLSWIAVKGPTLKMKSDKYFDEETAFKLSQKICALLKDFGLLPHGVYKMSQDNENYRVVIDDAFEFQRAYKKYMTVYYTTFKQFMKNSSISESELIKAETTLSASPITSKTLQKSLTRNLSQFLSNSSADHKIIFSPAYQEVIILKTQAALEIDGDILLEELYDMETITLQDIKALSSHVEVYDEIHYMGLLPTDGITRNNLERAQRKIKSLSPEISDEKGKKALRILAQQSEVFREIERDNQGTLQLEYFIETDTLSIVQSWIKNGLPFCARFPVTIQDIQLVLKIVQD